jgi:hypothetical protein
MSSHQTRLGNRHAPCRLARSVAHPVRALGSRQQSRCESSTLHRQPFAACLWNSVVGYFSTGLTARCSRRCGSPSLSQALVSGAAALFSLGRITGGAPLLSAVEQTRLRVSKGTEAKRKAQLGQFLTPARTAQFMAGLFPSTARGICRLLDPGAGIGSLSSAFLDRCSFGDLHFDEVELSAFELDGLLHGELTNTLASHSERIPLTYDVLGGDFVEEAVNRIQFSYGNNFTHTILNPPYKKINSKSRYRLLLRSRH